MGNPFKSRESSTRPIPKWSEISPKEVPYEGKGVVAIVQDLKDANAEIVILWALNFEIEGIMDQVVRLREELDVPSLAILASKNVDNVFLYIFAVVEHLMQVHSAKPKPNCPGWYIAPSGSYLKMLGSEMSRLAYTLRLCNGN